MILPDVLAPDLNVVFCGTAASRISAQRGAYYAGPGNAFWPTLYQAGFISQPLKPEDYLQIIAFGLGFTDLAKNVSGVDSALSSEHFDRHAFTQKILKFEPRFVGFTSKRAAKEYFDKPVAYGLQKEKIGKTHCFVLPSPSAAARRFWNEEVWFELAGLI